MDELAMLSLKLETIEMCNHNLLVKLTMSMTFGHEELVIAFVLESWSLNKFRFELVCSPRKASSMSFANLANLGIIWNTKWT